MVAATAGSNHLTDHDFDPARSFFLTRAGCLPSNCKTTEKLRCISIRRRMRTAGFELRAHQNVRTLLWQIWRSLDVLAITFLFKTHTERNNRLTLLQPLAQGLPNISNKRIFLSKLAA
ncbi:hypothetical protein E2320_007282 [Naja naja]|nr:hypothetical protein E2320_007282 [Naja naja]